MRGLLLFDGPSVEILEGQANLIVQTRSLGSAGCSGPTCFGGLVVVVGLIGSLPPHAKVIQRLRPKLVSTGFSVNLDAGGM